MGCGCRKARRIQETAERQQRLMTEREAERALAADLGLTPRALRALLREERRQ